MKSQQELQKAHDILVGILLGEAPNPFPEEDNLPLTIATDVLCWALDHNYNPNFGNNLAKIEAFMKERGINLVDMGDPKPRVARSKVCTQCNGKGWILERGDGVGLSSSCSCPSCFGSGVVSIS